jgi:hypothetical protein
MLRLVPLSLKARKDAWAESIRPTAILEDIVMKRVLLRRSSVKALIGRFTYSVTVPLMKVDEAL